MSWFSILKIKLKESEFGETIRSENADWFTGNREPPYDFQDEEGNILCPVCGHSDFSPTTHDTEYMCRNCGWGVVKIPKSKKEQRKTRPGQISRKEKNRAKRDARRKKRDERNKRRGQ